MKFQFLLILFGLLIFSFYNQSVISQNFESDLEVKEIRSGIVDVSWIISQSEDQYPVRNETYIQFTVELELWNPYNRELISYGSSSCRWFSILEIYFDETHEIKNSGEICTADYGPRTYPSGLSNETSRPSLVFLNEALQFIPNGNITVSGQGGTFENTTDRSYGVSITFDEGVAAFNYQSIPKNWGDILFLPDESESKLSIDAPFNLILLTVIIIGSRVLHQIRRHIYKSNDSRLW